ncbi:MAG: hypothetical protein Q9217_003300 [Psora testacea]
MQASTPCGENRTVKTSRLLLRRMTIEDDEAVCSLRCNPEVFYWRIPVHTTEQATQWLKDRLADPASLSYSVRVLQNREEALDAKVIGFVGATHLPEVGYMYDPSVWGNGYATEALRAWIEMYWQNWPDGHPSIAKDEERRCLTAVTGQEDGAASRRVLKKCGFKHVRSHVEQEDRGDVKLDVWRLDGPAG